MIKDEMRKLREQLVAHKGECFLCLATTANIHNPPLLVGSSRYSNGVLAGNLILRDVSLFDEIIDFFQESVSLFLVDAEIKGGVDLISIAQAQIAPGKLHFFKPNDFTIEALDEWIAQRVAYKPNLRAAVIGAGNIGAKISLRLAERGFDLVLVGRKIAKVNIVAKGLNEIARGSGTIFASDDIAFACANSHILLGCTPGTGAIEAGAVSMLAPQALLIDVGNGTFSEEAIAEAHRRQMTIEVLSPIAGWDGWIQRFLSTRELRQAFGRRRLTSGDWVVSLGVMGSLGDVLVDNISAPSRVIGICNGKGDLVYGEEATQRIKYMETNLGIA